MLRSFLITALAVMAGAIAPLADGRADDAPLVYASNYPLYFFASEIAGDAVEVRGRPFLGICVGMQLMASWGREYEDTPGLGWIAGEVTRISFAAFSIRYPALTLGSSAGSGASPMSGAEAHVTGTQASRARKPVARSLPRLRSRGECPCVHCGRPSNGLAAGAPTADALPSSDFGTSISSFDLHLDR